MKTTSRFFWATNGMLLCAECAQRGAFRPEREARPRDLFELILINGEPLCDGCIGDPGIAL